MIEERERSISVEHDSDGGLTINDKDGSGLVVSIISTHPDAAGPRGLVIEVYGYAADHRQIVRQEWPRHDLRGGASVATYYGTPRGDTEQ